MNRARMKSCSKKKSPPFRSRPAIDFLSSPSFVSVYTAWWRLAERCYLGCCVPKTCGTEQKLGAAQQWHLTLHPVVRWATNTLRPQMADLILLTVRSKSSFQRRNWAAMLQRSVLWSEAIALIL